MSDIKGNPIVVHQEQELEYEPKYEKESKLPSYGDSNAEYEAGGYPDFFDKEHMNWNFVFNEKLIKLSNLVFSSEDDFRKYKSMKGVKDKE